MNWTWMATVWKQLSVFTPGHAGGDAFDTPEVTLHGRSETQVKKWIEVDDAWGR